MTAPQMSVAWQSACRADLAGEEHAGETGLNRAIVKALVRFARMSVGPPQPFGLEHSQEFTKLFIANEWNSMAMRLDIDTLLSDAIDAAISCELILIAAKCEPNARQMRRSDAIPVEQRKILESQ
jgi:hypothetical protein